MARSLSTAEKRLIKIAAGQTKREKKKAAPRVRIALRRAKEKQAKQDSKAPAGVGKRGSHEDRLQQERVSGKVRRAGG